MAVRGYTREDVRRMLVEYQQRYALGARPPAREDRLVAQRGRQEDAPWVMTAVTEADMELALRALPLRWVLIAFMDLSLGASQWRQSARARTKDGRLRSQSWREAVGDWWGLSAGEVAAVTEAVIEGAYRRLASPPAPRKPRFWKGGG